ncbi:MAG: hypothetical protein K6T75_02140 [Acetobacteraceae bacterium]|nr:hypothetical protein [Acetobacteraceae bacterium]
MRELLLLLTVAVWGWRNALFRRARGGRALPGGGALILLLLTAAVALGSFRLLSLAQRMFAPQPEVFALARAALLTNAAMGSLLFMFMLGVRDVYDSLYQSPDLPFLLAAPLRPGSVYLARLLGTAAVSLGAALPVGFGAVLGAGASAHAAPWYYLSSALALALAAVLFCSLASLLILALMRLVSTRRLRQALLSLSLLASLAFVFLTQWAATLVGEGSWADPVRAASRLMATVKARWLPHGWLARAWLGPLEGRPGALASGLVALAAGAGLCLALSWWASEHAWLAGWGRAQAADSGRRPVRRPAARGAGALLTAVAAAPGPGALSTAAAAAAPNAAAFSTGAVAAAPRRAGAGYTPLWVLALTELRLFSREPLAWYGVGVMAVVSGFLAYSLARNPEPAPPGLGRVFFVLAVLLVVAGSWSRLRLVPMTPWDPAFWLIRCSPVEPRRIYWSKFLALFLPALALVALIYAACSAAFGLGLSLATCLAVSAPVLAAVASAGLWLEIRFPALAGPRGGRGGRGSRAGSVAGSLAGMVVAVAVMAPLALPWVGLGVLPQGLGEAGALVAAWGLALAEAGAIAGLAAWDGTRRLAAICRGREEDALPASTPWKAPP